MLNQYVKPIFTINEMPSCLMVKIINQTKGELKG